MWPLRLIWDLTVPFLHTPRSHPAAWPARWQPGTGPQLAWCAEAHTECWLWEDQLQSEFLRLVKLRSGTLPANRCWTTITVNLSQRLCLYSCHCDFTEMLLGNVVLESKYSLFYRLADSTYGPRGLRCGLACRLWLSSAPPHHGRFRAASREHTKCWGQSRKLKAPSVEYTTDYFFNDITVT